MTDITEIESGIHELVNGSGLPAKPEVENHKVYGGVLDGTRLATETAHAIEKVVEAAIAEHYRAADNLRDMERQVRQSADAFAERFRDFSKGFTGHVADFLTYAQEAQNLIAKHSDEFEQRIAKLVQR